MKKVLAVLLVLAFSAGACFAEDAGRLKQGNMAISNMSANEYVDFIHEGWRQNIWVHHKIDIPEYSRYTATDADVYNFDSFVDMITALDAGKIDRIELMQPVGEYFLRMNADKYIPFVYTKVITHYHYISMGFKDGNKWFEPFNAAIKAMNEDDTLLLLKAKYIDYAKDDLAPITFESFPDAETVKIAVTGDLPPLDYIAADGTPAGFNTALLAEIGRRLKVNIELLNVNAGARAAALSSGRADGVFWFWYDKTSANPRDIPAGVSLTEPYYSYDTFMYIGKKIHK
ncbi:MAG: transporter substrate-binding domain-containing protein [Synergistaceae bacterium]|nr:transporter substrate-binding domain-containing protein [Synergistaceae bacterium]